MAIGSWLSCGNANPKTWSTWLNRLEGWRVDIEGHNLPIALYAGWAELRPSESGQELWACADAASHTNKRAKSALQSQPIASRIIPVTIAVNDQNIRLAFLNLSSRLWISAAREVPPKGLFRFP